MDTIPSEMLRGHVDTIILLSLLDCDKHTNQIKEEIESRVEGRFELKQGTFYSCLQRIVAQGYVTEYRSSSIDGKRRKFYQLTEKGKTFIEDNKDKWLFSRSIIDTLISVPIDETPIVIDFNAAKTSNSNKIDIFAPQNSTEPIKNEKIEAESNVHIGFFDKSIEGKKSNEYNSIMQEKVENDKAVNEEYQNFYLGELPTNSNANKENLTENQDKASVNNETELDITENEINSIFTEQKRNFENNYVFEHTKEKQTVEPIIDTKPEINSTEQIVENEPNNSLIQNEVVENVFSDNGNLSIDNNDNTEIVEPISYKTNENVENPIQNSEETINNDAIPSKETLSYSYDSYSAASKFVNNDALKEQIIVSNLDYEAQTSQKTNTEQAFDDKNLNQQTIFDLDSSLLPQKTAEKVFENTKAVVTEESSQSFDNKSSYAVSNEESTADDDYFYANDVNISRDYKTVLAKLFPTKQTTPTNQNDNNAYNDENAFTNEATNDSDNLDQFYDDYNNEEADYYNEPIEQATPIKEKPIKKRFAKQKIEADTMVAKPKFDFSEIYKLADEEGFKVKTSFGSNKGDLGKILINKVVFFSSILFFMFVLAEVVILAYSTHNIVNFPLKYYWYFLGIIAILPVFSTIVYISQPRKKLDNLISFKNVIELTMVVVLNLILIVFVYAILIEINFADIKQLMLYIFYPLLVIINIPIYFFIKYLLLEKQRFYS